MCYMKSVSQHEKINEISVTGTSPSTFAHVHTLIPTTDRSPCAAYIHNMWTFSHMAQPHAAQSRILMWSLRALLSACVTFNPSKNHFQAHIKQSESSSALTYNCCTCSDNIQYHPPMMRDYTYVQCHLGSFLNINNKSAFDIDIWH